MSEEIPVLDQVGQNLKVETDHNLDTVIAAALELTDPTAEDIELYITHYAAYSFDEIGWLYGSVHRLVEARYAVQTDLQELGFEFEFDELFFGLKVLDCVLMHVNTCKQDEANGYARPLAEYATQAEDSIQELRTLRHEAQEAAVLMPRCEKLGAKVRACLAELHCGADVGEVATFVASTFDTLLERHDINEDSLAGRDVRAGYKYNFSDSRNPLYALNELGTLIRNFVTAVPKLQAWQAQWEQYQPPAELKETLAADKLIYGPKAAHLKYLEAVVDYLHTFHQTQQGQLVKDWLDQGNTDTLSLPALMAEFKGVQDATDRLKPFELGVKIIPGCYVPAALYQRWRDSENVDEELAGYYQQACDLLKDFNAQTGNSFEQVIVRSSAVYSEDGETSTGAGVYESIEGVSLESFDTFKAAVLAVWASTTTPEALEHQQALEVEEEQMGLVINPYLSGSRIDKGHLNSTKPEQPSLLEIKVGPEGRVALLDRDLVLFDAIAESRFPLAEHVPTDWSRYNFDSPKAYLLSHGARLIEHWLGQALQQEFVTGLTHEYLVQTRPLPESLFHHEPVEFPAHLPLLFSGRGIGRFSVRLNKADITVKHNSHEASEGGYGWLSNCAGLVMENAFNTQNGHLEQQCLEREVPLLTNDPHNPDNSISSAQWPEKLLWVSDGIIGRVYDATRLRPDLNLDALDD